MIEKIRMFYFPKPILRMLKKEIYSGIDLWLLIHFIVGFGLFFVFGSNKIRLIVFLLVGFEIFERYLMDKRLAVKESFFNSVLDVLIGIGGYLLAQNYIMEMI